MPSKIQAYENTRIVHKGPADGVTTFNAVEDALASITNATADNPFVVMVMPGTYTTDSVITVPSWVTLRGTSRELCKIQFPLRYWPASQGFLGVAGNSTIENITVEGNGNVISGSLGNASVILKNVTVSSPLETDYAIFISEASQLTMEDIITIGGGLIVWYTPDVSIRSSIISGALAHGIYNPTNTNVTYKIVNSKIVSGSSGYAIYTLLSQNSNIKIASSEMNGTVGNAGVVVKMVNCYDGDFNPIPNQ